MSSSADTSAAAAADQEGCDWRLLTPARVILSGPSQSGKSTLASKLVLQDDIWTTPFKKIVYAAPLLADRQGYLPELREVCDQKGKGLLVVDSIPQIETLQEFADSQPLCLILDDLIHFADVSGLDALCTLHSHHASASVLFLLQDLYYHSAKIKLTTLVRNATALILLWQLGDQLQLRTLNSRLFPGHKNFLSKCLEDAKERLGLRYLVINLSPWCRLKRQNICYTGLLPEERLHGSPRFYHLH